MVNDIDKQKLLEDTQKRYDYVASVKDDCFKARNELCRLIDAFLKDGRTEDLDNAYAFAFSDKIAVLYKLDPDACRYRSIIDILYTENSMGFQLFSTGINNYQDVLYKYRKCNFMLRRILFLQETEYENEAMEYLVSESISPIATSIIMGRELFVNRSLLCRRIGTGFKQAHHPYADFYNIISESFKEDDAKSTVSNGMSSDLNTIIPAQCDKKHSCKSVDFLVLSNDDLILSEMELYLSRLVIPDGVQVGKHVITDAKSMLSGMTRLKRISSADIKIFIHNDVFVLNRYLIKDIIEIFESDSSIGMVGMYGAKKVPASGIMWQGETVGHVFNMYEDEAAYKDYRYSIYKDGYSFVNAVDGLFIATNKDVDFREDLFDGWDLYDLSTSFEYLKSGYKIVVPNQRISWCYHSESEVANPWNYDKYRRVAMDQYKEFL